MSVSEPVSEAVAPSLISFLYGLPHRADDVVIAADSGQLTMGELVARVEELTGMLRDAGIGPGLPVANLVAPGPSAVVAMFAVWAAGGVYVPVNRRYTAEEVRAFAQETPFAVLMGERADLAGHELGTGVVEYDYQARAAAVIAPADTSVPAFDPGIALILRTSGTTGRPKAVLLRHASTIVSLDASLEKLRRRKPSDPGRRKQAASPEQQGRRRVSMIPVSLALWAGIYNLLFSFRAGFGVVLLDRFTTAGFARAVREFKIDSTVLAPAMITMLVDDEEIGDLSPIRLVRSITAPLAPAVAREFHRRFGAFVLNSYGQTELGGEVVGWTNKDVREFGESKLGAAGRPYDHVDLRIQRPDGTEAGTGEFGEIFVRSPYRMEGYAQGDGQAAPDDDRFVNGYLRTGDMGRMDSDGFLWVQGRVSDMINRGGLKVYPDEVEEVLVAHPRVRDAGVAGVPDRRLGEVPHAWVIGEPGLDPGELAAWCRDRLVAYKVPAGFTVVDELPHSEIGKLLRRELVARYATPPEP